MPSRRARLRTGSRGVLLLFCSLWVWVGLTFMGGSFLLLRFGGCGVYFRIYELGKETIFFSSD